LLPGPEALTAAQSLSPGLAIRSDGARLINGRCGAGIAWQEPGGTWKTGGSHWARDATSDAAIIEVVQALQVTWKMVGSETNYPPASTTPKPPLRDCNIPSQGQVIHAIAKRVHAQRRQLTIQWLRDTHGQKEMRQPTR